MTTSERQFNARRALASPTAKRAAGGIFVAVAALGVSALVNQRLARKAERENPPTGRFLEIAGVRLHFVDQGPDDGDVVVMLHGNGSMIQDFESSGLIDMVARNRRVIVFDRPGYGHTSRPRNKIWSPGAQADLIHAALSEIGVRRAIVMGHSWGCLVAVALADRHPDLVRGLVLASGYFFPTPRVDVVAMATPAVPVVGDIVRYAVAPPLSRLIWPLLLKKIFGPQKVPGKFAAFPRGIAIRPSQIRASAAESGLMIPGALAARDTYARLKMPVAIIAGSDDRIVDIDQQSARLHTEIRQSSFERLPGAGHMIHQTETNSVMSAIEKVSHAANIVKRGFAESRAARERG